MNITEKEYLIERVKALSKLIPDLDAKLTKTPQGLYELNYNNSRGERIHMELCYEEMRIYLYGIQDWIFGSYNK